MNKNSNFGWGIIGYSIVISLLLIAKIITATHATILWVIGCFIFVVLIVVKRKNSSDYTEWSMIKSIFNLDLINYH